MSDINEDTLNLSIKYKNEGNKLFKNKNYILSISFYTYSLKQSESYLLYSNRALAF